MNLTLEDRVTLQLLVQRLLDEQHRLAVFRHAGEKYRAEWRNLDLEINLLQRIVNAQTLRPS